MEKIIFAIIKLNDFFDETNIDILKKCVQFQKNKYAWIDKTKFKYVLKMLFKNIFSNC
jgi:hypothetical protein